MKFGKIGMVSIVFLSLFCSFLILVVFRTNNNIESLSHLIYGKMNNQSKISKTAASNSSEVSDAILAPRGVATMSERIFLEREMSRSLLLNDSIYGVRNIDKDENGEYGTGFLIDGGIVATADHVLQPTKIVETFHGRDWSKVGVLGRVQTKDIAFIRLYQSYFSNVVRITPINRVFESFPSGAKEVPLVDVMVGMKCMALGEPRIVIGELSGWNRKTGDFYFIVHSDPEGCSGTAVYSADGSIIGLFQTRAGMIGGALDIGEVKQALNVVRGIGYKKERFLSASK